MTIVTIDIIGDVVFLEEGLLFYLVKRAVTRVMCLGREPSVLHSRSIPRRSCMTATRSKPTDSNE